MTAKNGISAGFPSRRAPLALAGLLLAVWVLGATEAQAQVQIDQVQSVASQVDNATQGQVVVTIPEECKPADAKCEDVSRSDITGPGSGFIPAVTPALPTNPSGNSAVIFQEGDDNDATINQRGSGNQASITQLNGDENDATVVQEPGGGFPGENNLAVIVQDGSFNETTIRQRGRDNVAGIKLDGSSNGITLEQTGKGNEYLLDFEGSLGTMGNSTTHQVSQIGSNNRLVQVGENSMPFNVRQRGDGMRMVIRHGAN
jgi:hypothetical protein